VDSLVLRQITNQFLVFVLSVLACSVCRNQHASAQRARFPDTFQVQSTFTPPQGPSIITAPPAQTTSPPVFAPPPTLPNQSPIPGGQPFTPPATTSSPVFAPPTFPNQSPIPGAQPFTAPPQSPVLTPQQFSTPAPTAVPNQPFPVFPQSDPGLPPAVGQPQAFTPGTPYTQVPPNQYQGTGSTWLPNTNWDQSWNSFQNEFLPRLIERPRARYTFIPGSGMDELGINDLEIATTATIADFLGSTQPLRISPGFIFHWWNGPDTTLNPGFDLPARAYSAYLQFDHLTNPANQVGLESNFAIGYYGDFQNTASYSLRFTGRLIGWVRINPYTIGKLGVEYIDRVDKKMLPAFGVYMVPNSDVKWDLFFPRTKLAHRTYNIANGESWIYLGAEYGGGSWAIERIGGVNDQADINDVRAFVGLDWLGPRRVSGFFEVGYVFNRQIVYRSDALTKLDLKDAVMIRTGLAF
jgi:hypothetical protein